jgi:uncharacterized protein involved in exopolysaccharide biosynthesis
MNTTSDDAPAANTQPSILLAFARDWRLFRNCVLLGVIVAGATILIIGRRYTTTMAFTPQAPRSSQLSGIAAQFGLDLSASTGAESPYFYVELMQTKDILWRVATHVYTVDGKSADYASFSSILSTDSAVRGDKAIKHLAKRLNVVVDRRSGIITVDVTDENPQLAFQLATTLLSEIGRYNRESRQTRAAAERKFVESRLDAARGEFMAAEDSMQAFMTTNRDFRASPALTFEYDRLQRSITQRAAVVTTLVQSFEQARIDEVRDTPVISIVQPPGVAARADPRGSVVALTLGVACGLIAALLFQLTRSALSWLRAEKPEEYEGWTAALADMRRNLLRR